MYMAGTVRHRYPNKAIHEALAGYFTGLTQLTKDASGTNHNILITPDSDSAMELRRDDDTVDDLHHHLIISYPRGTGHMPPGGGGDHAAGQIPRALRRYHRVSAAGRIVYLSRGLHLENTR